MGKTIRPVNGAMQESMTRAMAAPIIPVKTEAQLIAEVDRQRAMEAEIARLKAENERLQRRIGLSVRKSEKGAVSVYGLGRWPFTLYKEQWLKLLAIADEIRAFIADHDSELSAKEDK